MFVRLDGILFKKANITSTNIAGSVILNIDIEALSNIYNQIDNSSATQRYIITVVYSSGDLKTISFVDEFSMINGFNAIWILIEEYTRKKEEINTWKINE